MFEHLFEHVNPVVRSRHRYSPRARAGYELYLPDLLEGALPTTAQAQRMKALVNQLTDDELEHLLTPADLQPKGA